MSYPDISKEFGGFCFRLLRLVTLGMEAFPIPAALPISRVQNSFDEDGNPRDEHITFRDR